MGLLDQGLFGMGGLGGMSGNAKQQALLGSAFDPQEQKRQMLKQGLLGAGIAMLGDGNIASGMKGGLEGAYGAQQGYMQNAKTAMEMNAQKTKQAQEERQQAAIMQWIDGLPPDQQEYAHAFPEQAAQEYAKTLYPTPPKLDPYTLGEGQIRYGADNKPVAQGPAKTATPTDDMREFGFAQSNPAFSDYMLRMKKAGANQTNIDMKGENAYSVDRNKGFAKKAEEFDSAELTAQKSMNTLSQMENMVSDPSFYSGFGADQVLSVKRMAAALGADPSNVNSMEQFNTLSKQAALDNMGGSLGTGFSNADRDFVVEQVAQLGNTPEGNKSIIAINRKQAQRKIEIARMARDYEAKNGRLDSAFMQQLSAWAEANPLFPKNSLKSKYGLE
jgi:hypothetical protein